MVQALGMDPTYASSFVDSRDLIESALPDRVQRVIERALFFCFPDDGGAAVLGRLRATVSGDWPFWLVSLFFTVKAVVAVAARVIWGGLPPPDVYPVFFKHVMGC